MKESVNDVLCERIIDAGKNYYKGRNIVVLFNVNGKYLHWVTNSNTKQYQKIKEGNKYNLTWARYEDAVSYVVVNE